MTPETANQIALRAVREVLAAAHGCELQVAGTAVRVSVTGQEPSEWPRTILGLDENRDGPWPQRVSVRCSWEGGAVDLSLVALAGRRKEAKVVIALRILPRTTPLGYSNVSIALVSSDEPEVPIVNWFGLKKRKAGPLQDARNRKLRALVAESGMPMLGEAAVELFRIRVEDGSILPPGAAGAFERLVHINLLKLDFFSRGPRAKRRGRPLIDLGALGLEDAEEQSIDEGEEDDEDEPERKYWAGGFGEPDRLFRFLEEHAWEINWKRDDDRRGAHQSWSRFDQINVGDWFAIKGFGGSYQLVIHFIGEVTQVDRERGRVELRPLPQKTLYKGPAPRGSGANSWFDTVVPITRKDIIELIFGDSSDEAPALSWNGPSNLILYGPPGTGKTYKLRDDYLPRFVRRAGKSSVDLDSLLELSWFEVLSAALADAGGEATPMQLAEHEFVRRKYQAKDHKARIGTRIWNILQSHTVRESTTVNYSTRLEPLVFNKREDGTWSFVGGIPDDARELAAALRPRPAEIEENYLFVTFHQSYAYEDFIEGIRPKSVEADDGQGPRLTYELEDGVFLRAANAAVRLTGFEGTMEELCRLPFEDRAKLFEDAPRFAVFIDEINRGNVSRVFGELITLIEEDKRLGAQGELMVTLPYSRRRFGVPKNLCLIGTMNTADRSVEALDSALRRRFAFEECAPDLQVLKDVVVEGGIDVALLLQTINARLEVLLDRDHLIGQSYFMGVKEEPTIEKLKSVFSMNILPLLSEYFYSDLGRIGLVLGRPFVRPAPSHATLASFDHEAAEQFSERVAYRLVPIDSISTADFRSIYESGAG